SVGPGENVEITAYATVVRTADGQVLLQTSSYNGIGLAVNAQPGGQNPDILEQLEALGNLITALPQQFGGLLDNLIDAFSGPNKWDAVTGLATGLKDGFTAFVQQLQSAPLVPLVQWLLGPQAASIPIESEDDVPAAILKYLGLDEETIRSRIINILGEGNLEALDAVAAVFNRLDDPNNPVNLNDPKAMWGFLTRSTEEGGLGLNVGEMFGQIVDRITDEAQNEIPRVLVQLAVKFAPGLSVVKTILSTGEWLLDNAQDLQTGLQPLFSLTKEDFELESGAAVKAAVLQALPQITTLALDFIARQFGLDRIKKLFREKIKDLPGQIEDKIRAFVLSKLPANRVAPGGGESPYVGQVGARYTFAYKNESYQLIVARQSKGRDQGTYIVRIIQGGRMIVELDAKQITANPVFTDPLEKGRMLDKFNDVVGAAGALEGGLNGSRKQAQLKRSARRQGKSNVTPGEPTTKVELGRLADNLRKAIGNVSPNPTGLLEYLELYGCALLNAGCFAAGTKLWTPDGYRNVEDIQVGDLLFSRDEGRPDGLVEAKPVEQVFRRFTEVVHLHVGGRVIRTTDEHPFYVYNKGWVPVAKLAARDYLLTAAGDWKPVEEVYRTGELEVVYNLRVADHHTYFVG
ncbi:MAG TPA: polymorphic toxin-type HINT domain-containing protein, partial [Gemmataceae bacterium]|nr:polymorphic toxin-type HINT domain-containing protein [Gemmataceae bacterium]